MYRDHSVGVIVPAYNEAAFIGDVIASIPAYVDRIYVVDDCSTDKTWDAIQSAAATAIAETPRSDGELLATDGGESLLAQRAVVGDPIGRLVPIQHRENRGAGGAIKTGYLAARAEAIDVVTTVDGDGQMDLSLLPKLLDPIVEGEADYAKGNRLLYKEFRRSMPRFRFVGNAVLTFLTKIASGYWKTMDPQNGYTAISRRALDSIAVEDLYEYYGYCNDLLVKLNAKGMRVADVAMPAVYGDEESSIQYTTYIRKVSTMLLRNFLWRLKVKYLVLDFHPLALFYLFGAGTTAVGLFGVAWAAYTKLVLNDPLFVRASIGLLLTTMGSMFLMFAMLFDMQVNEDKETQLRGQ